MSSNNGIGPTLIIWCTAGVSGMFAPAMRAIRGLQTPHAMITTSASMAPLSVWTRFTAPFSTSIPVSSVLAEIVSAPWSRAHSRISVPARSESTTVTPFENQPPVRMSSLTNGTCSRIWSGVSSSASSPHAIADDMRRLSSSSRCSVRATSSPPGFTETPSSSYWRALSIVSAAISFEWSTG